jgi:hypothetical protein
MKNFDLNSTIAKCVLGEQYSTNNGWTFVVTGKHYVNPDGTYWHVTLTAPDGEKRDVESKGNTIKGWLKKSSFARAKGTGNGAKGAPVQNMGTSEKITIPKNSTKLLSYDQMDVLACDMVRKYKSVCQYINTFGGTETVAMIAADVKSNDITTLADAYRMVNRCVNRYQLTPYLSVITHLQRKQRLAVAWAKRKARRSIEYKQRLLDAQQRLLELKVQIADAFNDDADMETLNNLKTAINEQTALVNHLTAHIQ